jgi:hypothetical protein
VLSPLLGRPGGPGGGPCTTLGAEDLLLLLRRLLLRGVGTHPRRSRHHRAAAICRLRLMAILRLLSLVRAAALHEVHCWW